MDYDFSKICSDLGGVLGKNSCKLEGGFVLDDAKYLFGNNPEFQTVVKMKPYEFLSLVPPFRKGFPPIESSVIELREKMKADKPMDPLFLDVDVEDCKVLNHEGRHRALVANLLGISEVPVILYAKKYSETGGFFGKGGHVSVAEKVNCKDFKPQKWR